MDRLPRRKNSTQYSTDFVELVGVFAAKLCPDGLAQRASELAIRESITIREAYTELGSRS